MKYVYVILDNVSGVYTPLFLERNERAAKRQFAMFLANMQYSPSNFDLYVLAAFCEDSTSITDANRLHIINGAALDEPVATPASINEEALKYVP